MGPHLLQMRNLRSLTVDFSGEEYGINTALNKLVWTVPGQPPPTLHALTCLTLTNVVPSIVFAQATLASAVAAAPQLHSVIIRPECHIFSSPLAINTGWPEGWKVHVVGKTFVGERIVRPEGCGEASGNLELSVREL
jgi:hypothetical protein